jgi:phosphatidylglycerol:prolipoprotein diacylglycerol transferase
MLPITLNLGFRIVYNYEGFYFLVSILLASVWAYRRWQSAGLLEDSFSYVVVGAIFGAIVGARISHFLFWDMKYLLQDPLSILRVWEGGLSVSGGVLGGVLASWIVCRVKKLDYWKIVEILSPTVLLGQAVGRIGCFLNGDAFGLPTSLPWGVRFARFSTVLPGFERDTAVSGFAWLWCAQRGLVDPSSTRSVPMHPTQLYESALDILLMIVLLVMMRREDGNKRGKSALLILVGGYSITRFFLEFIRADNDGPALWGMTSLQLVLLGIFAVSAFFTPIVLRRNGGANKA